jgi:hypothetical protein
MINISINASYSQRILFKSHKIPYSNLKCRNYETFNDLGDLFGFLDQFSKPIMLLKLQQLGYDPNRIPYERLTFLIKHANSLSRSSKKAIKKLQKLHRTNNSPYRSHRIFAERNIARTTNETRQLVTQLENTQNRIKLHIEKLQRNNGSSSILIR